jgi:hypothetical protein
MRKRRALSLALAFYLGVGAASAAPKARPRATSAPVADSKGQAAKTMEVAQKVYLQGAAHYKAGRLLEALAAFRASYDMVASPNSHIMIARTLRDKGDIAQAYAEYDHVVTEADQATERDAKYKATADAARAERSKLREKLTMIIVRVRNPPEDLRVAVGNKPIERADWGKPVPVMAGALLALGVAGGRPDQRQELSGFPGDELVVLFDYSAPPPAPVEPSPPPKKVEEELKTTRFPPIDAVPDIPRQPPRPAPPPTDRTWAYVSLGAGGAGLLTFLAFGALNQSTYNDLQASCPNMHCPPGQQDEVDKGRRYQVIANVGLGLFVVGGSVGAILLTTGADAGPAPVDAARRPQGFALTDLAIGPGSVQVRGAF